VTNTCPRRGHGGCNLAELGDPLCLREPGGCAHLTAQQKERRMFRLLAARCREARASNPLWNEKARKVPQ